MSNYQVGQILYLISGSSKVVPVQVYEEVIRTTIHGKEKTYVIKFPDKEGTTTDVKNIKGQIFNSVKDVKDYMMNNAKNAIDEMTNEAETLSVTAFSAYKPDVVIAQNLAVKKEEEVKDDVQDKQNKVKVQQEKENDIIKIDLGNGRFGKISSKELKDAGTNK